MLGKVHGVVLDEHLATAMMRICANTVRRMNNKSREYCKTRGSWLLVQRIQATAINLLFATSTLALLLLCKTSYEVALLLLCKTSYEGE